MIIKLSLNSEPVTFTNEMCTEQTSSTKSHILGSRCTEAIQ